MGDSSIGSIGDIGDIPASNPALTTPFADFAPFNSDAGITGFAQGLVNPFIDIAAAAAAPATGGASLAIPFALTGLEDTTTNNWSGIGGQLLGDAASAIPFGAGQIFGALGGAAGDAAGGALGGAVGTDAGSWAGGALGGAADSGFGFADLSGAFGGVGDTATPAIGDFAAGGAAAIPSAAPAFGGNIADAGAPLGAGGGSAPAAANPFGADPSGGATPGVAYGQSGPIDYTTFGKDPSGVTAASGTGAGSAPALTGPGNVTPSSVDPTTGNVFPTDAGGNLPTPGGVQQSATVADAGVPGSPPGSGTNPADTGMWGGIRSFLKDNKDLISLGTGALGVGNAVWKNAQMQGGIDALMAQAQAAKFASTQFQQGYNSLLQQALPLIQAGANGQVNPGQAAAVLATANRMKAEIDASYAARGASATDSNRVQDLNNVELLINGLQGSLAMSQITAGAQLVSGATGQGGLNAGNAGSIGQYARLNAASDQELINALTGFAGAAAGGGGSSS